MQSFNKKLLSAKGKAFSFADKGITPLLEGKFNFENIDKEVELLANERKKICILCNYYEDEPIDFFKVNDERINELTSKMCGECFCTLSYKLRQSKKKCNKWIE
jgi:hypothetical protein